MELIATIEDPPSLHGSQFFQAAVIFGLGAKCHNLSVSEVPVPLGRYAWGKTSEVGRDE
jgi:hypothetical protein